MITDLRMVLLPCEQSADGFLLRWTPSSKTGLLKVPRLILNQHFAPVEVQARRNSHWSGRVLARTSRHVCTYPFRHIR
jgi:hypothetical protein